MPCIVAFDDESVSPDGGYTILPIDDPAHTWSLLRKALELYALDERVQAFNLAVESMDDAQRAEMKARDLQPAIMAMMNTFPSGWNTILDLGDCGPSQRLERKYSEVP